MKQTQLTGLHLLLTLKCVFECDHCFVYSGPFQEGVMSLDMVEDVLKKAKEAGHINEIYVEGGEPFLYYPIMIESLKMAKEMGFSTGLVTNCYWATTIRNAVAWLKVFKEIGLDNFSISMDQFHQPSPGDPTTENAIAAAKAVGMATSVITIQKPLICENPDSSAEQDFDVLFKGRAADTMAMKVKGKSVELMTCCESEDLAKPTRVHIDPWGDLHVCQGVSIGNIKENSLVEILENYDPEAHPVIAPLLKGGPLELAKTYHVALDATYADNCHCCYTVRKAIIEQFPEHLRPKQMYGIER